ncbi:NUDIX hydrolase [Gellertiella hungarica]|uniref:ADP-ribose pyrophosphatase YjhB (NUDIX family) n=1 Tax=Gellertiella hungarica TaxID=1572859 RepID=A0A7W6NKM1_9HYPH|nr:NUDIX domain-containing protein [Gellertiella hungarica]MBB4065585.1 ADP-ribose pyrophosphatase YjhB (NUDIX family) [Gellertiella hungarica]
MSQPAPASSAIVRRDGRYLLVRRRNPPAADLYAFPGGRAEAGETPAEAALRECLEETGIEVANPRLFATYDLVTRNGEGDVTHHYFLSVFAVEETGTGTDEALAADDAAECGWYSADEVRAMPVPASVLECVERLEMERFLELEA